jgi:hypothetical protein
VKKVLTKVIAISVFAACIALFVSLASAEESGDGDSLMPMTENSPTSDDMAVSLHKDRKAKPQQVEVKAVQLIKPAPNSQFTPGVLNFNWAVRSDIRKGKMTCVLENLDTGKSLAKDARGDQASFDLKPGNYRWRIVSGDAKIKSAWRAFEVTKGDFDISGRAPAMDMDNLASQHEAPDLTHLEVQNPNDDGGGKVDDDKKLKEYKHKKDMAEQEANDLEKRVKSAELDARKALQLAKEQQNKLKAVRLEKIKQEKLAKERWLKLEADRKAKIKRDKLAREKQLKELHLAQAKVKDLNKKLQIKILEAKKAKVEADRATVELTAKIEAIKRSNAVASAAADGSRTPAKQTEAQAPDDAPLPTDD